MIMMKTTASRLLGIRSSTLRLPTAQDSDPGIHWWPEEDGISFAYPAPRIERPDSAANATNPTIRDIYKPKDKGASDERSGRRS